MMALKDMFESIVSNLEFDNPNSNGIVMRASAVFSQENVDRVWRGDMLVYLDQTAAMVGTVEKVCGVVRSMAVKDDLLAIRWEVIDTPGGAIAKLCAEPKLLVRAERSLYPDWKLVKRYDIINFCIEELG